MSRDAISDDAVLRATAISDLPAMASVIDRVCRRAGVSTESRSDLRLAAEEVFINIFRHGYRSRSGPVTMTETSTPRAITVRLADAAPEFDPATLRPADTSSDWQNRQMGGLGWYLVHQVMDEVHRTPGSQGGNVYTLVKQIHTDKSPDPLIS